MPRTSGTSSNSRETNLTPRELLDRWAGTVDETTLKTLANWRMKHVARGPRFRRHGGKIYYPLAAVEEFERTGVHWGDSAPTSTPPAAQAPATDAVSAPEEATAQLVPSSTLDALRAEATVARRWALHHRHRLERFAGRQALRRN